MVLRESFALRRSSVGAKEHIEVDVEKTWGIPSGITGKLVMQVDNPSRFTYRCDIDMYAKLEGFELVDGSYSATIPSRTNKNLIFKWNIGIGDFIWNSVNAFFDNETKVNFDISAGLIRKTYSFNRELPWSE